MKKIYISPKNKVYGVNTTSILANSPNSIKLSTGTESEDGRYAKEEASWACGW